MTWSTINLELRAVAATALASLGWKTIASRDLLLPGGRRFPRLARHTLHNSHITTQRRLFSHHLISYIRYAATARVCVYRHSGMISESLLTCAQVTTLLTAEMACLWQATIDSAHGRDDSAHGTLAPSSSTSTCQIFRFLDLPAEIRVMIYRLCLVAPEGHPIDFWLDVCLHQPVLTTQLLMSNKQIYREASIILYTDNLFCSNTSLKAVLFLDRFRLQTTIPIRRISLWETGQASDFKALVDVLVKAHNLQALGIAAWYMIPNPFMTRHILKPWFNNQGKPRVTLGFLLKILKPVVGQDADEDWGCFCKGCRYICFQEDSRKLSVLSEESQNTITDHYHREVKRWYEKRKRLPKDFLTDCRFKSLWEQHRLAQESSGM